MNHEAFVITEADTRGIRNTVREMRNLRYRAIGIPEERRRLAVLEDRFPLFSQATERFFVKRYISSVDNTDTLVAQAEDLATSVGLYFSSVALRDERSERFREEWFDKMSDLAREYTGKQMTLSKLSVSSTAEQMVGLISLLSQEPERFTFWSMFQDNNMGTANLDEFLDRKIGVVSPLSTDILAASFFRGYLQLSRGETFPLRAIALSQKLICLPVRVEDPLADCPELAIYIDYSYTGETGGRVANYLKKNYPKKIIHRPRAGISEPLPIFNNISD